MSKDGEYCKPCGDNCTCQTRERPTVADHCWFVWDTLTDRQAGINSYFTREQCERDIAYFQERQARGGRPDLETSGYVVRKHPHDRDDPDYWDSW